MTTLPLQDERLRRSHSQRACMSCRSRKSRCKFDAADPSCCLMCRFHSTECTFSEISDSAERASRAARKSLSRLKQPSTTTTSSRNYTHPPGQVPRNSVSHGSRRVPPRTPSPRETPFTNPAHSTPADDTESHIIGPVLGADTQLIANYLLNDPASSALVAGLIRSFPGESVAGRGPILFNTVRRYPLGSTTSLSTASCKYQIVEKLVEPFCLDLIDLYFEKEHECFPLLDEASFKNQYITEKESISPALLASLYAHTMVFWKSSCKLSDRPCPDIRFVWNQANDALYSELHLSPGISTVIAILLNISGRPLTTMIGNGVLLGSAISLAHALGLNRNCLSWDISSAEKRLRTRIWWGLVIYDKWSSVAYGTPPQLRRTQHDVPAPSLASLYGTQDCIHESDAASVFVGLATLTDVLDIYLENVFHVQPVFTSQEGIARPDMESLLTQWEDSLPVELRRLIIRGVDLSKPGSSNLRLAYLYVKLLSRKLEADDRHNLGAEAASARKNHTRVRRVAEEIVLFVQELDEKALSDFWLPLGAFALSSTVLFLMRGALEMESHQDGLTESMSLNLARDMVAALQSHRQCMGWDLGDICIAQYSDIMAKITTSNPGALNAIPDLQQFMLSNAESVDDIFPSIWDVFVNT